MIRSRSEPPEPALSLSGLLRCHGALLKSFRLDLGGSLGGSLGSSLGGPLFNSFCSSLGMPSGMASSLVMGICVK